MTLFSFSKLPRNVFRQATGLVLLGSLLFSSKGLAQTSPPAWRDHLTHQDVINALGEPLGDLQNGATERMVYKGGLLIILSNNQVTSIEGTVPDALKPQVAPPAASPPAATAVVATTTVPVSVPVTSTPASTSSTTQNLTPSAIIPSAPSTSGTESAPAGTEAEAEKIINDFSSTSVIPQGTTYSAAISKALGPGQNNTDGGGALNSSGLPKGLAALAGGGDSSQPASVWANVGTWQGFVAGLLLKTVLMTLVLKGTFAYKEFPVLWREAAFVAVGVSFCNQTLAWLFSLNDFGKIANMVQADQLIAGAVLLALIMNFTAAKQLPTAAGITIAAMTANIAVGYAQLFLF